MNAFATAPDSGATRILLAIGHGRTRAALRTALERSGEIEVAALVSSSVHLARMAAIEHVDVVVFDLRLAPPGTAPSLADLVASLGGSPWSRSAWREIRPSRGRHSGLERPRTCSPTRRRSAS